MRDKVKGNCQLISLVEPVADIKVVIFKAEPIMTTGREATVTKKRKTGNTEQNGRMIPPAEPVYHNKMEEAKDREGIVIWKRPLVTLNYFVRELGLITATYSKKLWRKKFVVLAFVILLGAVTAAFNLNGPHQKVFNAVRAKFLWCAYWVGLGVLSSVGLGTGLHTFLLYLGPHIASVTLAAYECGSLNFPSPPYPDEIICPDDVPDIPQNAVISLWSIMSKVRLEAFMWGAGTALGELPPYFMARAARMSGYDSDDEDLEELEVLLRRRSTQVAQTTVSRAKLAIQNLVEKVGFFGILACASIPNPLFDLAGITCGHFLVPFWTFFGATLIGKAVIKMHIQKMFVIIAFNEALVEKAVSVLEFVPYIGGYLHAPFREFLEKQKAKLHRRTGAKSTQEMSWLSSLFEKLVIAMVVYFVLSIVNSLAQKYHKRLCKRVSERSRKLSKD